MNTATRKGFRSLNLVSTVCKVDFATKSSHALTKDLRQGGIVNTAVSRIVLFEFRRDCGQPKGDANFFLAFGLTG